MARVRTSGKVGALGTTMPLSQLPAQLIPSNLLPSQLVAKWLPALAHGFEPAPQALVTPRLRLLRRVGDERPGSVWVADHLALATPVEVTFAEVDPGASPETQAGVLALRAQSCQSRTEATARINEPHLVSIIEHGDVRGLPFIVTELLEGGTHDVRHRRGACGVRRCVAVVGPDGLAGHAGSSTSWRWWTTSCRW